jgi:putative ABC transport system ATP-binding protein
MTSLIEFKNVYKIYGEGISKISAADDVSFTIESGEFVVILGPSGAGKSTILNILGGMDYVTSGNVFVEDKDISKYNDYELANYRAESVGFVFQFYNLIPTLTALENVELIKEIVKNPLQPEKVLEMVGLKSHLNNFPSELSGGEQQRVSIARAIAKNPKILLCDEPTGALDSITGVIILKLLDSLVKQNNQTVIIVTHNQAISKIADKIIKIKNGKIISAKKNINKQNIDEVEW